MTRYGDAPRFLRVSHPNTDGAMTAYTITTKYGTFTRKTARTYTHLVVSVYPNGFAVTNWCGRAHLAQKAAADNAGLGFATIVIVDIATGEVVTEREMAVTV